MRKDSIKLLIIAGIVGFAILYGMELSSSGISRVYGPLEPSAVRQDPAAADEGDWTLPPRTKDQRILTEQREPLIPRNDSVPVVDRISGKAAEALHGLSSGGIKFVVSLFDRMTGS